MTIFDMNTTRTVEQLISPVNDETQVPHLRACVERAVENYFMQLEDTQPTDLYGMVISEVEEPLLRTVMKIANNNQCRAAQWLGVSRGTLRKKLEQYDLL